MKKLFTQIAMAIILVGTSIASTAYAQVFGGGYATPQYYGNGYQQYPQQMPPQMPPPIYNNGYGNQYGGGYYQNGNGYNGYPPGYQNNYGGYGNQYGGYNTNTGYGGAFSPCQVNNGSYACRMQNIQEQAMMQQLKMNVKCMAVTNNRINAYQAQGMLQGLDPTLRNPANGGRLAFMTNVMTNGTASCNN